MKKLLCVLAVVSTLVACNKTEGETNSLYGNYVGIFNRTGMDTAQVTLVFNGNHFEGHSNKNNYPAICRGSFRQEDSKIIHFSDSCAWTANFDWSLVLSGKYNISFMQGMVRIWKTHGAVTDEYLLRQPN